jgi:hypothetical protein
MLWSCQWPEWPLCRPITLPLAGTMSRRWVIYTSKSSLGSGSFCLGCCKCYCWGPSCLGNREEGQRLVPHKMIIAIYVWHQTWAFHLVYETLIRKVNRQAPWWARKHPCLMQTLWGWCLGPSFSPRLERQE